MEYSFAFEGNINTFRAMQEVQEMITVHPENFSVKQIARSGQCFRMNEIDTGVFQVTAFGKRLSLIQEQDCGPVTFCCGREEYDNLWKRYFDLDTDYRYYIDRIDPKDQYLSKAVQTGGGIRILRQELWETMVSFIISQNNNIPRIKSCIEKLCLLCGKRHTEDAGKCPEGQNIWHEFPRSEDLLSEEDLAPVKLGYRAKYITSLAQNVVNGTVSLKELSAMEPENAEKYLKSIYGIGAKVAACIQLFSLHHLESFPIDTWIKQIITAEYDGKFPVEIYSGFAGVIQQYIFYYARERQEGNCA